jgi:methyl-accepting chemotaxis protein
MKKKLFSLNFKQVLIIVTPLAVVALFVMIAFSQLMGLIINDSIKSSMGFVCEKVEYETRPSLEKGDYSDSELFNFINELDLTANTNANIIDKSGNYITRHNPKIARSENYFADSALKKYTSAEYLDGEAKSFVTSKHFFAVRKIGNSDFFVIIEGPMSDYTNQLAGVFNIILIITIILIFCCVLFFAFIINRTNAKEKDISDKLIAETQNLAVSSKETAATAQDQSAAVKEIVTTMEDNTALSEDISQKIKDVSGVAAKTNGDVAEGVSYIEENVKQLQLIADTNLNTINGIKALGDKIENIWDIVTLINSVADQAKIIAFNAELEASSAGEAGKNFHIVATEIRRLADGIIDGTKEIKEKINEIQQSSDALILASENGTEKITQGVESAKNLESRFSSIKNASEITAESAEKITTIIQQQAIASEQILVTLKQIASGVENFTAATEHISKTSQNLKTIATELGNKKQEEA